MVNIIVPVYHGKQFLPNLIKSLEIQTKKIFMTTFVIDCDGEDYSDIINNSNINIKCIYLEKNMGQGAARQAGIDASYMFDYIMFADQDDMFLPYTIDVLYDHAKKKNLDIVTSDMVVQSSAGRYNIYKSIDNQTWLHGKIYKRKYLVDNNITFHKDLRANEDSYFNYLAVNLTKKKEYLPIPTYIWCNNHNSQTRIDGSLGFGKISMPDYVLGQIYGCYRLIKELPENEIQFVIMSIRNCYFCCQNMIENNIDSSKSDKVLFEFLKNEKINKYIKKNKYLKKFIPNLYCGSIIDSKPTIYHESLDNWIKRITGEECFNE